MISNSFQRDPPCQTKSFDVKWIKRRWCSFKISFAQSHSDVSSYRHSRREVPLSLCKGTRSLKSRYANSPPTLTWRRTNVCIMLRTYFWSFKTSFFFKLRQNVSNWQKVFIELNHKSCHCLLFKKSQLNEF